MTSRLVLPLLLLLVRPAPFVHSSLVVKGEGSGAIVVVRARAHSSLKLGFRHA